MNEEHIDDTHHDEHEVPGAKDGPGDRDQNTAPAEVPGEPAPLEFGPGTPGGHAGEGPAGQARDEHGFLPGEPRPTVPAVEPGPSEPDQPNQV